MISPTINVISAVSQVQSVNANSFLVEMPASSAYTIVVTDKQANQLAFTHRFAIGTVSTSLNTITVTGDVTDNPYFLINQYVYITGNTGTGVDGAYDVTSVTSNGTTSVITINQDIPLLAEDNGYVHFVAELASIPYWPSGTAVTVSTTSTLPTPLEIETDYYYIPSNKTGYFNLALTRYPSHFLHYVDITSFGVGTLSLERAEPCVPGDMITVANATNSLNNGIYTVRSIVKQGNDFRLFTIDPVPVSETTTAATAVVTVEGFGSPVSDIATRTSDTHIQMSVKETISFVLSVLWSSITRISRFLYV